jgi:hypothetical protein
MTVGDEDGICCEMLPSLTFDEEQVGCFFQSINQFDESHKTATIYMWCGSVA